MAKEKKAVLVCKPCGFGVTVSDLGSAVVECWECGLELEPGKAAGAKKLVAAKKKLPGKAAAARKPAAAKPAAKKTVKAAARKAAPKKAK